LTINYIKTGADQWSYEVDYSGNANNITGTNPILTGTMTFNSDGSLANADTANNPPSGNVALSIPWSPSSGLAAQNLTINMGTVGSTNGVTQFDSPSALVNSSVDGALFGSLTGVSVDGNGFVTANFSNGLSEKIYQVPLANFTNADGLAAVSGDAYQASSQSGAATVNAPNSGGSGAVQSSELESSTVDLATEFTNLITTQRAYSASARIVTTADQMLQTLEQLPSS
jgi:flagellar hook protein FlgE